MIVSNFVKNNNYATFSRYRKNYMYYTVAAYTGEVFEFPIDIQDLGDATINYKEKALLLMRYIRKAIEDNTMVLISKS